MTIRSVTETVLSTVMCEQSPWSPGMELDPRLLLLSRRSLLLLRCLFSYYLLILCNTLYWCWPLPDTHITFGPQIWFCCSGSNCLGPCGCQPCQERRWYDGNSSGQIFTLSYLYKTYLYKTLFHLCTMFATRGRLMGTFKPLFAWWHLATFSHVLSIPLAALCALLLKYTLPTLVNVDVTGCHWQCEHS